jgi:hypothetical protein
VAELLCGALEALVNANTTASIGGDPTAEVFEAVCAYRDGRPEGVAMMCVVPSSGFVMHTVTAEANTIRLRSACVPSFLAKFR